MNTALPAQASDSSTKPRSRRPRNVVAGVAIVTAVTFLVAACSSSGGGNNPATTSAGAPTSGTVTSSAGSSCQATAAAAVAQEREEPAVPAPAQIDMSKLAGKKIWMIRSGSNSFTDAVAAGFSAAAKAAGMQPTDLNANRAVNTMVEDVQSAVDQKADAVVLFSISPDLVKAPLAKLIANKIPVVDLINAGTKAPLAAGLYAHVDVDVQHEGTILADWVLADSGCKANAGLLDVPTYVNVDLLTKAEQAELQRLCPDCKNQTFQAAAPTQVTDIQRQTQTAVQGGATYLFSPYDVAISYIQAGLAQTGKTAKVVSISGDKNSLAQVAKGGPQTADFAWAPAGYIGWATVATLAQGMTGVPGAAFDLPARLVDGTNVGDGSDSTLFPSFSDYESKFKAAWGMN
jgi:ribose transport system substrate-binding protein